MTKRVWDTYLDSLSLCGCEQRWREKEREREEVITKSVPAVNQSHAHNAFSVSVCLASRLSERLECRLSISLGWIVTLSFPAAMACLMPLFNESLCGSAIYHLLRYSKGHV